MHYATTLIAFGFRIKDIRGPIVSNRINQRKLSHSAEKEGSKDDFT